MRWHILLAVTLSCEKQKEVACPVEVRLFTKVNFDFGVAVALSRLDLNPDSITPENLFKINMSII